MFFFPRRIGRDRHFLWRLSAEENRDSCGGRPGFVTKREGALGLRHCGRRYVGTYRRIERRQSVCDGGFLGVFFNKIHKWILFWWCLFCKSWHK